MATARKEIPCVQCGKRLKVPFDRKGQVRCPACGSTFEADTRATVGEWIVGLLVLFGIVSAPFLLGWVSITTTGCDLPIDLVFGDVCVVGSFGASAGASLISLLVIGTIVTVGGLIGKAVGRLFAR